MLEVNGGGGGSLATMEMSRGVIICVTTFQILTTFIFISEPYKLEFGLSKLHLKFAETL